MLYKETCLQSAFEDRKRLCCLGSQWEFVPPPGCQHRETSWCMSSTRLDGWRVKPSCTWRKVLKVHIKLWPCAWGREGLVHFWLCRQASSVVTWVNLEGFKTSRAAAFWVSCPSRKTSKKRVQWSSLEMMRFWTSSCMTEPGSQYDLRLITGHPCFGIPFLECRDITPA